MPAIEVWSAKECVVLKRSMATGYSGVTNPLFHEENVNMCFGDAKETTEKIFHQINMLKDKLSKERSVAADAASDEEPDHEDLHPVTYPEIKKWLGVIGEAKGETRVAITPKLVTKIRQMGFGLYIEKNAGKLASFDDAQYLSASRGKSADGKDEGVKFIADKKTVFEKSDVLCVVAEPSAEEIALLKPKHTLLAFWNMFEKESLMDKLKDTGATVINMGAFF